MKKCVLYCTACVLLGILVLCSRQQKQSANTEYAEVNTLTTEEAVEKESLEVTVLNTEDVLSVIDRLNEASDVHIDFVHTLVIDDTNYEMDVVGSSYNYDVDRGHISVITDKFFAEVWYSEDETILETSNVEDITVARTYTDGLYQRNLYTVKLICSMLTDGKLQQVYRTKDYTVYKAYSNKQMAETNLLHVTADSTVRATSWVVRVPHSQDGEYTATLNVFPNENASDITCERFSYKFRINTGFRCKFPESIN